MSESATPATVDRFGIFHALVQHMREGCCCDELANERLFPRQVLRMIGTTQMVIEENFAGDTNDFIMCMYLEIATNADSGEDALIIIERWLNKLLQQAAILYPSDG